MEDQLRERLDKVIKEYSYIKVSDEYLNKIIKINKINKRIKVYLVVRN